MTDEQPAQTVPASAAATRSSGVATASLVLGILSIIVGLFIVLGWVLGLLAAILGGVALRQPIANASTARAGRLLGIVGFLLTLVVFTIRFSTSSH